MSLLGDATRLAALAALLASLMLLTNRARFGYGVQCTAVGLICVLQAVMQSDWQLLPAGIAVILQATAVLRQTPADPPGAVWRIIGIAAALIALATVVAPTDVVSIPLAMVLIGLLGGGFGVLGVLNACLLMAALTPGLPLRAVIAVAVAGTAVFIATGGPPQLRLRR